MASSEHLKDLKAVWGKSCHSMWAELLSISITEQHLFGRYSEIDKSASLASVYYAPELRGKIDSLSVDVYIQRSSEYRSAIITNRIIILSASFETYFANFLDAYVMSRPKLYDNINSKRLPAGDKLCGEVLKIRGLSARIEKFAELAPSKIGSIRPLYSYLDDIYMMRNVLAHRAGSVDAHAASVLQHVRYNAGDRIILSTDQLLQLAAPLIKIAEALDRKLTDKT